MPSCRLASGACYILRFSFLGCLAQAKGKTREKPGKRVEMYPLETLEKEVDKKSKNLPFRGVNIQEFFLTLLRMKIIFSKIIEILK